MNLDTLLLLAHAPLFLVEILVLSLAEALRLVVHQELLSYRALALLLGQSISLTPADSWVVDHSTYLEVLRQLLAVIGLVEPILKNAVSELDSSEVCFDFVCQLYLLHMPPVLARSLFSLLAILLPHQLLRHKRVDLGVTDLDLGVEQALLLINLVCFLHFGFVY